MPKRFSKSSVSIFHRSRFSLQDHNLSLSQTNRFHLGPDNSSSHVPVDTAAGISSHITHFCFQVNLLISLGRQLSPANGVTRITCCLLSLLPLVDRSRRGLHAPPPTQGQAGLTSSRTSESHKRLPSKKMMPFTGHQQDLISLSDYQLMFQRSCPPPVLPQLCLNGN